MQVFNYASYAKAFELGVSKPNMTKIAKALFEPIVGAEGVVNRVHNPYVINSKYAKAWYQQAEDIPENIKKAAGRQDIVDGIGDYFASDILDVVTNQMQEAAMLTAMTALVRDSDLLQEQKDELFEYYEEDHAEFLGRAFLFAVVGDNLKKSLSVVEEPLEEDLRKFKELVKKAQIEHYTEYIKKNPTWEFAGIYADDGISGTNTKKREEFNRLIDDCMSGQIDMVVTKSISRFARNTLDYLNYIRQLKDKNIPVYFEKEGINTLDAKGEVLLTIMASLAQQESQSLSQNVRLGLQYRYQQGRVQVCTNRFLGYDKDEEGKLIINPEEAEVVRRIYREYLEGKSYYDIGKGLTADGIKTAAGSDYWLATTLRKILRNEKYIGDALLQKTITTDFLTKKRVENKGIVPQYYVEGSHEAIIPKELYMMVQEEMVRRANLETSTGKRRIYSGKYALSSIVYCAHCGDVFQRTHWNVHGRKKIVWRCVSRLHKKDRDIDCPARTVTEADLHAVVVQAINEVCAKQELYLPQLKANIEKMLGDDNSGPVAELNRQIGELEQQILQRTRAKQDCDDLGQEVLRLRDEKYQLQLEDATKESARQKITELENVITEIGGKVDEYDDALVRKLIERITVYDDYFTVEFKSGIEIDVQL